MRHGDKLAHEICELLEISLGILGGSRGAIRGHASSRLEFTPMCAQIQSWLPANFEFLSGLPEAARKRRRLVVIQAFIDESGVRGTDPFFVMAGFVAAAESWASFSDEWSACLMAEPRIDYLKMNEAAKLNGQFRWFTAAQRDKKLRALVEVLKRYPHNAIHCSIDLGAYDSLDFEGPMRDTYYFAFNTVIAGVCIDVLESDPSEKVEIFFDEHAIFGPRVSLWYPLIRDTMRTQVNDEFQALAKVMPPMPSFKRDEEFPPLQAADILAWLLRNALAGQRNEFEWIAEELMPHIPMSIHSSFFDKSRLERIERQSYAYSFDQEHIQKWRPIMGVKALTRRKRGKQ